jgi:hypothetical protein
MTPRPAARDPEPAESVEPVRLPPEVAEELIGYGLQTNVGAALWRGWLLGRGLPKGDGAVTVLEARYRPAGTPVVPSGTRKEPGGP